MTTTILASAALLATAGSALAQFSLTNYHVAAAYALPSAASEASAITYNHDTGTLFVLGDEGDALVEVNAVGAQLSVMSLTGFDDTEGLAYIGAGRFVLTEERIQDAYRLVYAAGGAASRASLPAVDLGPTVGNIGIEGVAYEASTDTYFTVNEKTPQLVRSGTINFDVPGHTMSDLFVPNLGVLDLSDVAVLSTIGSDSLLVFSQESSRLLEVSRAGVVLSSLDFSAFADNAEGVAVGPDGTIYIVGENPTMYVLVPAPGAAGLLILGVAAAARRRR